jgi:hypothetical protein
MMLLPAAIVVAVVYAAPVWAFTTLVGDRFGRSNPDPNTVVPAAGVICAVGLAGLVIGVVSWTRGGRRPSGAAEGQAGIAAVLGTLSVVIATRKATGADVQGWPLWILPIVLTAVAGAMLWWLLVRAKRAHGAASRTTARQGAAPVGRVEPLKRVRLQVERLSAEHQLAVRRDITAAIDALEARAVISHDEADRARDADLGKLALRMSQGPGPAVARGRD